MVPLMVVLILTTIMVHAITVLQLLVVGQVLLARDMLKLVKLLVHGLVQNWENKQLFITIIRRYTFAWNY